MEGSDDLSHEVLSELLALMAHDFRNPLSALHSNVGFLMACIEPKDDDTRGALEDALVSCDGLADIIDNLEILGQALGTRAYSQRALSLGALVEEAVKRYSQLAKSHEVSLALEPRVGIITVISHRGMLANALSNVLRNSIQHAPPGSSVRLAVSARGTTGVVGVFDDGVPLDTSNVDPFSGRGQTEAKSHARARYSRGLGLLCAALAARAAGAQIASVPQQQGNGFELSVRAAG
jgi:two-component system heavy metal sensor histidine kinase CusS